MHVCKQVVDIDKLQVHEERIQLTAMDKKDKYRYFQNLTSLHRERITFLSCVRTDANIEANKIVPFSICVRQNIS